MKAAKPILLVGNALSTMVAAVCLARSGAPVTIINPVPNWGGHFARVDVAGERFDPGMVTYEFTSFSPQARIDELPSYDPRIRSDVGRFCDVVRDFVREFQSTRTVESVGMALPEGVFNDLIIANEFDALPALPFAMQVERELSLLPRPGELHASQKRLGRAYESLDFETASRANHGDTLHQRLMEPYCRKLLNIPSSAILARYHRVAWLPLLYPETLLSALRGKTSALPPTEFSYPIGANVGDLAARLHSELSTSPNVRIVKERPVRVERDGEETRVTLPSGESLATTCLGWSSPLADLLLASGHEADTQKYDRSSVALVFLRVESSSIERTESIMNVVDPAMSSYRITNQSACGARSGEMSSLVLEVNPDHAGCSGPDAQGRLADLARSELVSLGYGQSDGRMEVLGVKVLTNALMLPTRANRDAHQREEEVVLDEFPNMVRLGPASGFFTSSLNDQVVQGMKLAQEVIT